MEAIKAFALKVYIVLRRVIGWKDGHLSSYLFPRFWETSAQTRYGSTSPENSQIYKQFSAFGFQPASFINSTYVQEKEL